MTSMAMVAQTDSVGDLLTHWYHKLQLGTVPAWFGGLSLLLALVLFLRDRRKDDREQIDKVAIWVTTSYELRAPHEGASRIEEIELTFHTRNGNEVPIDVHLVAFEVKTWWSVPSKDNDPDNDRKLLSWSRKPGTQTSRLFKDQFLLPPNDSLPEHLEKHHVGDHAPERATQLHMPNGAKATVRWFLAIDNAGRRWEVCPGRGRRARRIRWYSRRREFYPVEWQQPVLRWLTVQFFRVRDMIRKAKGSIWNS